MNNKRLLERFEKSRFVLEAGKKAEDPKFMDWLKEQTGKLADKVKGASESAGKVVAYVFGKDSDWGMRIYAIASLIYFISPLDFIPDFIPGIGYIEDIAILAMMAGMIASKVLSKESELNLPQITQDTAFAKGKTRVSMNAGELGKGLIQGVSEKLDETAQNQVKIRVRGQLIIVIISLSGAIVAAIVTLLLKFVFKVF